MDNINCSTFPEDANPTTPTPTPPILKNCDFETDFCGWSAQGEEFIWKRSNGSQEDESPSSTQTINGSSTIKQYLTSMLSYFLNSIFQTNIF